MKQLEKIHYLKELYEVREMLHESGIARPIKELVSRGLVDRGSNNYNYLSGRVISQSFLIKLKTLI